jgi:dolichyl-phosphate-mannose--protein O-mannosyl transferase
VAFKYLIAAIITVSLIAICFLFYKVQITTANNLTLTTELAQSKLQASMQQNIITQYSQDSEYMNQLLTDRAKRSAQAENQLHETIKTITNDVRSIECTIPKSVTDKLRESY